MPKQTVEMRELVGMSPASGGGTTPILSKNIYNGPAASGAIPEKYANPVTDDTIAYSEMSVDGRKYALRVHDGGEISIDHNHDYGGIQPEDAPIEIHQVGGLATIGRNSLAANANKIVSIRNRSRVNYIVESGDIAVEDNIIKMQTAYSYINNIIPMSPTLYILSQFGDDNLYAYEIGDPNTMYNTNDPFCYGPIVAMAADMSIGAAPDYEASVDEIYIANKNTDGTYRITRLPATEFMNAGALDTAKFAALIKSNTGARLDSTGLPSNAYLASIAVTANKVFIGYALAGGDGKPMPITGAEDSVADNQDLLFSIDKADIPAYGTGSRFFSIYTDDDDVPDYPMYRSKLPWEPYSVIKRNDTVGDGFGEYLINLPVFPFTGTPELETSALLPHKFLNDSDQDIISAHLDNMSSFIEPAGSPEKAPYPIKASTGGNLLQNAPTVFVYWGAYFGIPIPGGMGLAPAASEIAMSQYVTGQIAVVDYAKDVAGMLVTTTGKSFAPVNGVDDPDLLKQKWGALNRHSSSILPPSASGSQSDRYADLLDGSFEYDAIPGSPGSLLTFMFYAKGWDRQTVHCKKIRIYTRNTEFPEGNAATGGVGALSGNAFLFTWCGTQALTSSEIEYDVGAAENPTSPYDVLLPLEEYPSEIQEIDGEDVVFNDAGDDIGTFTIKKYFDTAFNSGTNRGVIRLSVAGDLDYSPKNPRISNTMTRNGAANIVINTISDPSVDIALAYGMPPQKVDPENDPPTWSDEQGLQTDDFDGTTSKVLCHGLYGEKDIAGSTLVVCDKTPALTSVAINEDTPLTFDAPIELQTLTTILSLNGPIIENVEDSALVGVSVAYRYSFTYDGIQEGPLSEEILPVPAPADIGEPPNNVAVPYSVPLMISLPERFYLDTSLSRRITHINIFATEIVGDEEATLYRLFKKIPLSTDYFTLVDRRWKYDGIVDVGMREETFEVLAGYPENIKSPSIKHGCSCMYNGHVFAANVFTYDENQVEYSGNILVRSQPYQPSVYDYTREFAVLSFSPNALVARDGKIYAFGNDEYSVVDADTLAVEGTNKILGCASANHVVANDYGVFVFYKDNVYALNGLTIEPMASHISRSEFTDIPTLSDPQVKESTTGNLLMGFSNSRQSLILIIRYNNGYIMYTYSFANKTWVLYEMYGRMPRYLYHKDGEPYLADGTNVTGVFGDQPYPVIYLRWIMDLGDQADDVYIYSIKGKYKHNEVVIDSITINGNSFPVTINASDPNVYPGISDINMAITSPVDCIDIVVRRKIVR